MDLPTQGRRSRPLVAQRVGRRAATSTAGGQTLSTVTSVYSPTTADQGMAFCTLLMGTWSAN